jgi:hypothetical protein
MSDSVCPGAGIRLSSPFWTAARVETLLSVKIPGLHRENLYPHLGFDRKFSCLNAPGQPSSGRLGKQIPMSSWAKYGVADIGFDDMRVPHSLVLTLFFQCLELRSGRDWCACYPPTDDGG